MKERLRLLNLGLAALVFLGCVQQTTSRGESTAIQNDVEAIRALLERNAVLLSTRNLDGWIDQFTDDAIFMPQDHVVVKGREAGREFVRPWYESFDSEFNVAVDEVEVHGGWAFARWSFTSESTPVGGGGAIERNGKEIWIFRRQPDGSWKCSHIIYNYDAPTPDAVVSPWQQEGEVNDG